MSTDSSVNRSELKERLDIQTTPLLRSTTLAALLQASGSLLTADFMVKIMVQVCRGIQAAHDKGLHHGALNPSNILILEDNTGKMVAVGLADAAGNQSTSGRPGAQDYSAPEQLGHGDANPSSDVFSLGVIAYEALTLEHPFKRSSVEETEEAIRHFVPPRVSETNPQVPELVSKAVQVALAKLPCHRFSTAGEFADMLEKAGSHPNKSDASEHAISDWLDRARAHMNRHDFPEARRALTEIFNLQYDHPEAARLKLTLEAHEAEANSAGAEKERLFTLAQRHQRNGELGSALTQLEKLLTLSRHVPASSTAEREKAFEALYAELRNELERVEQYSNEANEALAGSNFEKALAICNDLQARYPNNQEFQALRLKAQQAQRQELLAYAGEVARSVEAEPNLDGRVCLLKEAVKRYPNEELLARQFSLACEQRDLAASIVAKARAYEAQGQFAEAAEQWKALLGIYPLYPGLAAEIQQLEQRREQKAEEDKRSRLISEIERALTSCGYSDAERLSREGLRAFPENPQLLTLLGNAQQGFEKCREADRLLEQARTVRVGGDADGAMTLLRKALDLDPRHIVARNTLVHLLLERARALFDTDRSAAERFTAEAAQLDPEHAAVRKINKLVAKATRKKPRQPALLAAGDPAPSEPIPVVQPTKLFLDDDFPESPRGSQRAVPQSSQAHHRPAVVGPFRDIGSVFVYNIKSRLRESDLGRLFLKREEQEGEPLIGKEHSAPLPVTNEDSKANGESSPGIPLTARQIRGFVFAFLGAVVAILLLSFADRYVSRPNVQKPRTAIVARIAPISPATPVAIRTAPSYAIVAPDADPNTSTTPALELVSRQRSSPVDRIIEHPAGVRSEPAAKPVTTYSKRPIENSAKSLLLTRFTISAGTPGANVTVDDLTIGELDEKGNFAYAGITAGTHKIELSKPGYGSRTFYGQVFLPGKPFDLPGAKQLAAAAGYLRITVSSRNASVSYKRSGESMEHPVSDLDRALALAPGAYEFTAKAPHFGPKLVAVKIQADQTATISFD